MDCINDLLKKDTCIYCTVDCDRRKQPLLSSIELMKGEAKDIHILHNAIISVIYGDIEIDNKGEGLFNLLTNNIIVFPAGSDISVFPRKNSMLIIYLLVDIYKLCPSYCFEKLFQVKKDKEPGSRILYCNSALQLSFEGAHFCTRDEFMCKDYSRLKVEEVLFLLRTYYRDEELAGLLYPLLSPDLPFRTFIFENHKKINSVEQFAYLANMTKDGFIRKFKRIFGVTPGNWLVRKKKNRIKYELVNTNKAFKEISYDHGFSHVGSFSKFCSKNFGLSPIQIRGTRDKEV